MFTKRKLLKVVVVPREDLEQQTYLRFLSKLESVRKTWVGQPSHLVRVVAFFVVARLELFDPATW